MATNDFLPFAGGAGANVLTQAAYIAQAALRSNGFSAGTAQSAQLNKVWRQSSIMSAVLAQLIADNTGADVLDDGTTATILANLKSAVGGRLIGVQVFTASGTYTPTAGTKSVVVEAVGGGGAGGGSAATTSGQNAAGGGGGAGSYAKGRFTSGFAGVAVTVGAAGAAAAANSSGGNGGTSSFGALLSCPGGNGGGAGVALAGTAGLSGLHVPASSHPSGGNIVMNDGQGANFGLVVGQALGGAGGSTVFGDGGHSANSNGSRAGSGYGAGSSGATAIQNTAEQGSVAGRPGIVIVWEYA